MNRGLFLLFLISLISAITFAQSTAPTFKIARNRLLWHENIDKQQKKLIFQGDGIDETMGIQIEYALVKQVDELQEKLEKDTLLGDQGKIKYLRLLECLIKGYNDNYKKKDFPPTIAPALVTAFKEAMELDRHNESIEPVIEKNTYGVDAILLECLDLFTTNKGIAPSRTILLRKYLGIYPTEILRKLRKNPNVPFADSLLNVAAHRDIREFYDYAQERGPLSNRMSNHPDTLVHMIAYMASSRNGQLYFPFLDNLLRGKLSFKEIDSVKNNELNYYRLLVKTRIDYAERVVGGNTPMQGDALTKMMAKKAKEVFISEINGLHDEPDAIRFKILEPLNAQELYYLAVLGEDEIYTSSYVRGVFPRIFQRMKVPRADSLFLSVSFDYFRKFIKMAAAYNTLDTVLKSMPQESATLLMKAFMIGLEKKTNVENVEDAVDVADSYSSIVEKNKTLARFMLNEAIGNYERCERNNDKNGQTIYRLCKILFESADTSKQADLSALLGIPPVYSVSYKSLTDDSGRVVQQVFFYGDKDKDGQNSYANFMGLFRNKAEWSVSENPDWVSIKSIKGKPVWIFANKPLLGENDPDEAAKEKLVNYLKSKNLTPTIFIHRGHSYHVKPSLARLQPSARIVVLGSCGGYNNLNEVLTISPDAHIISSKQTGTRTVNEPILQAMNSNLRNGKNIDWLPMWRDLSKKFKGEEKELFDDYVPPYKNLGAIFIKAYRKALE